MSILGVPLSEEEGTMICRVAMAIWEHEHLLGPNVPVADVKFPIKIPNEIIPQGTKKI
jgi:hypothetical protein